MTVCDKVDMFKGGEYIPSNDEINRGYEKLFKSNTTYSPELITKFINFTCGKQPVKEFPQLKYA